MHVCPVPSLRDRRGCLTDKIDRTGILQDNAEPKVFINNHLRFTVLHNYNAETDRSRIVGFEVEEYSVKHRYEGVFPPEGSDAQSTTLTTCNANRMSYVTKNSEPQTVQEGEEVIFTYDVLYQVCTMQC